MKHPSASIAASPGHRTRKRLPLAKAALLVVALAAAALVAVIVLSDRGVWLTPDQLGHRLLKRGQFTAAAEAFRDPLWQGTAWYRAGEFAKAAQAFARRDSAEARFNEGNARVMLGKYDTAVGTYDKALALRPGWPEARENRDLAAARAKLIEQKGGDLGDQKLGADKIVFDKKKQTGGQDTQVAGETAGSDATMQAMWLRRVNTRPADFLKAKFAWQQAMETESKP